MEWPGYCHDQQWDTEPGEYTSHKGKFPFKLREEVVHVVRVDTEAEEPVREEEHMYGACVGEHHEEGTNSLLTSTEGHKFRLPVRSPSQIELPSKDKQRTLKPSSFIGTHEQ